MPDAFTLTVISVLIIHSGTMSQGLREEWRRLGAEEKFGSLSECLEERRKREEALLKFSYKLDRVGIIYSHVFKTDCPPAAPPAPAS